MSFFEQLLDIIKKMKNTSPEDSSKELTKFQQLSELCKKGDIVAMYEMAMYWYDQFSDSLKMVVKEYEEQSSEDSLKQLKSHKERCENSFSSYTLWLVRAAFYGHEQANSLVEKCDYYLEDAYIPYKAYVTINSGKEWFRFVWLSKYLTESGFCDVIDYASDCRLIFDKEKGYIELLCDFGCSADNDGFGAESDWSSYYYDEFFNRITGDVESLQKKEAEREVYWQTHNQSRKYKKSVFDKK